MFLPRFSGKTASDPVPSDEGVPRGHGERVLVADDDLAVAEMIRRGLEDHGYRVVIAGNGVEAVGLFKSDPGATGVVVCDVAMPGLDGPGIVEEVRRLRPEVPIVLMSGEAEEAGESEATHPSAPGLGLRFLSKPFVLSGLLRTVHEALRDSGDPGNRGSRGERG